PLLGGAARGPDGGVDAAPSLQDLGVAGAARAGRVLGYAAAVPDEVRVAVDEARQHAAPAEVDPRQQRRVGRAPRSGADPAERAVRHDEGGVGDALVRRVQLRHTGDEDLPLAGVHDDGDDTATVPLTAGGPQRGTMTKA